MEILTLPYPAPSDVNIINIYEKYIYRWRPSNDLPAVVKFKVIYKNNIFTYKFSCFRYIH